MSSSGIDRIMNQYVKIASVTLVVLFIVMQVDQIRELIGLPAPVETA